MKTEEEYSDFVLSICKPGKDIIEDMEPRKAHELHMAIGVAGEAGELLDAIKKYVVYNKDLDLENVIEELGDLEFYMEGLRSSLGVSRTEVIVHNVRKLSRRYSAGSFSNKQAQDRADKE